MVFKFVTLAYFSRLQTTFLLHLSWNKNIYWHNLLQEHDQNSKGKYLVELHKLKVKKQSICPGYCVILIFYLKKTKQNKTKKVSINDFINKADI